VLLNRHLKHLGDLALALGNKGLDLRNDLVNNLGAALDLDAVSVSVLLGELDGASKLPAVVATTSLENNIANVRA